MAKYPRRLASRTIASYPHLALVEHDVAIADDVPPFLALTIALAD